jgi:sugar phosphate isomerase/epimerase
MMSNKPQLGIQLYSVRDRSEKDFLNTIREIGEIGYRNVEMAGYFGHSAKEVRKALDDAGLHAPSAHVGLKVGAPDVWDHLKEQVAYSLEVGIQKHIVPWYPLGDNPTLADVDRMADTLRQAAEIVTAAGLSFGYHNHAFEFKPVEGELVIDRLMSSLPAELLFAEFDLGWVQVAGQDPAAYIRKYAGRLPVVHAKDFKEDGKDTEIGRGTVDWSSALAACEASGVEYVIVEQEQYDVNSLESAKLNFAWFKAHGWV